MWAFGAFDDGGIDQDDLRSLGAIVVVLTGLAVVGARTTLCETARQRAYDAGYEDGCEASRPQVVPIGLGARRGSTLFSATKQLSEKADLGRGS